MREKIAEWLKRFKGFLDTRDWTKVYGASEKLMYLSQSKELCTLITEEIEKVENPFGDKELNYHHGFMRCRQKILSLLKEESPSD